MYFSSEETGIAYGLPHGAVCVDMGTVGVECVENVALKLAHFGVGLVDAPVSGGSWGAEQGTLSIMGRRSKSRF